jgi:plasmid maintenance system antidote protein VapI
LRLSAYFGNSAEFWLGLQMDHDLWVAANDELPDPPYAKVMPRMQAA